MIAGSGNHIGVMQGVCCIDRLSLDLVRDAVVPFVDDSNVTGT